ncbi:hypothetical protein [Poseidonibacter lekithochrous]|uniref:hypothetical protein n=1 Tax=Poseidonibacter lekithochrous TaxID=1904463 RepID=UPI0008FC39D4|nr:hypothetical protein [Poseidonibacter lekithochrous]QKJ22708.1 hypothetical protein ALEK_1437 [Poseidonibacter lekithochrous]
MEISTLLLLILIPLAIFLIIKQQKKTNIKSAVVKKEEIIEEYKRQIREVISKNKNDQSALLREKTILLKKINYELSMNLFFDEKESKKIILELLEIS